MKPANGTYYLSLPPIPWPATVIVTDAGVRVPSLGPTVYPYSMAADAFAIAPDSVLICEGGSWRVTKGELSISGPCL